MFLSRTSVLKELIAFTSSCYFAILLQSVFDFPLVFVLITGLLLFVAFSWTFRYLIKPNNRSVDKKLVIISIAVAILIIVAFGKSVIPSGGDDTYTTVNVTALGEKNESSHSNEVWITEVSNDQTAIDLNSILLSKGWEKRNNALISYKQQPATLTIKFKNPSKPVIRFMSHPWSGKVKIVEGKRINIVDLYNAAPSASYSYTSAPSIEVFTPIKTATTLLTFLALGTLVYITLLFAKYLNNYFPLFIAIAALLFFIPGYNTYQWVMDLVLLAISLVAAWIMQRPGVKDFIITFIKPNKIFFSVLVIYAAFSWIGGQLFIADYPVINVASKIAYLLLFCCWIAFMAIAYLFVTWLCKTKLSSRLSAISQKKQFNPVLLYLTFFAILLACWSVYFIAFYPANMTADSLEQWGMANGIFPLRDAHPVLHTLIIKLLIHIAHTPVILAIAQILFMAAVSSSFLLFLYKAGIPFKWLIAFALLEGIAPANGVNVVTLWKDIPYSCALLWITLMLAEILSRKYIFNYKTTLISLGLGLFLVALLRHNGIVPALLIALLLILISVKERKKELFYTASISMLLVFGFKTITPRVVDITPTPTGIQLSAPIHGIASVIYYKGDLDPDTRKEMEKILPTQMWLNHYYPYSCDPYLFRSTPTFMADLSKLPTKRAMKMYIKTFIHNPYLIIRDRLTGTDLLWDVSQPKKAFNFMYAAQLDKNKYGFRQTDSELKDDIEGYLSYSKNADEVLWRAGLYNILIFFLIILVWHKKRNILVFLPLLGNYISLMIAMTHQDFRYVYSIPFMFGFIWLLLVSDAFSSPLYKTITKNQQ
jgi:hypothetical protein